jgi:hypothetical protein
MPTQFDFAQSFTGSPLTVFAMLSQEDFILAKCSATGSLSAEASVAQVPIDGGETVTLISTRVLPADLPGPARSLVGDTITVTETQIWTPPAPDGSRTATITVDFSAPMTFSGTLHLSPGGQATTTITTRGKFTASVPFIGGKIEKVAAEQTQRYLVAEERVGNEWLAD